MNALIALTCAIGTVGLVAYFVRGCIKATRTPPRNKRVNLPPPQAAALSRRYADT